MQRYTRMSGLFRLFYGQCRLSVFFRGGDEGQRVQRSERQAHEGPRAR